MIRRLALAAAAAGLLAGCGGDTTTVIQQTTTTVSGEATGSNTTTSSTEAQSTVTTTETTDDGGTASAESLKSFQSPSGNIACLMSAKSVRCDIQQKDWTADRPAGCPSQVDYGQGLTLTASGSAAIVCAGDTVLNPQAPMLAYGSSSQVGPLTCTSTEADVECSNGSGGRFSISRQSYDLG